MNTNSSSIKFLVSLIILLLFALVFSSKAAQSSPLRNEELRRADMIEIAERYVSHVWTATQENILHGERQIGENWWQIDTPDLGGVERGWWVTGTNNIGAPYLRRMGDLLSRPPRMSFRPYPKWGLLAWTAPL